MASSYDIFIVVTAGINAAKTDTFLQIKKKLINQAQHILKKNVAEL